MFHPKGPSERTAPFLHLFFVKHPQVYQMSTKKWCQSLGAQGIGKTSLEGWSTRCLPFSLFYVKSACFNGFSPVFLNFRTLCKGRDTAATGPESRKTSKNLDKMAKIVSKRLNLRRLPNVTAFHLLSKSRPLSGRKIL